jgi:hypothetical protein
MKVADLMEMLEGLPEDADVRFAHQPSYPFEYSIRDVVMVDLAADPYVEDRDMREPPADPVVYLVEGAQVGYLPGIAAREIGWRG